MRKEFAEGNAMLSEIEFEILSSVIEGEKRIVIVEMTIMGQSSEAEFEFMKENGKWVMFIETE